VTSQGLWPRPMKAPDASVSLNGRIVALSSLRGRPLRIVAEAANSPPAPPLPPESELRLSSVVLAPGSDAWQAYSIVSGVTPEALGGCVFLVDANGWLRALFKPRRPGEWPDPALFMAAAREAEKNPLGDADAAAMQMHMGD